MGEGTISWNIFRACAKKSLHSRLETFSMRYMFPMIEYRETSNT